MSYRILNLLSATEYVRRHPLAKGLLNSRATLECTEIGDGNLNLVFRVFEKRDASRSVLLKQGIPYLRVAGEAWPLSPERARIEAQALEQHHKLAPSLVPKPYWFDAELNVNAMEDLQWHQVLRRPMVGRTRYENLGTTIGEFLAATLFGTSDFGMEAKAKKALAARFVNGELCEITEDLILTEPFEPKLMGGKANRNNFNPLIAKDLAALQADAGVRLEVVRLKQRFMTCAQAMLHGDLHTGSIMASAPDAKGNADIRVIDPEFAFYGPMGFDVGLFVANLFLNSAAQQGHAADERERRAYRKYLYTQAERCWKTFETGMRQRFAGVQDISWSSKAFQTGFIRETLQDTCGYAGCEMIRRTVGFAHVYDLESIPDPKVRAKAERLALRLGRTLIKGSRGVSIFTDLMKLVRGVIPEEL
jgi:5-methylthioribose kinase